MNQSTNFFLTKWKYLFLNGCHQTKSKQFGLAASKGNCRAVTIIDNFGTKKGNSIFGPKIQGL